MGMITKKLENQLIARAKAGDGEAMAGLIRSHQDALFAFILRMSQRPDVAEDIVQEAFVRVLKNIDRFESCAEYFARRESVSVAGRLGLAALKSGTVFRFRFGNQRWHWRLSERNGGNSGHRLQPVGLATDIDHTKQQYNREFVGYAVGSADEGVASLDSAEIGSDNCHI